MKTGWWVSAAALALAGAGAADAQNGGGWRVIGWKAVGAGTDTDNVYTPGRRHYRQLRLCAERAPMRLVDVDVYFRNGQKQDFDFRGFVGAGGCTRNLDLRDRYRDVSRVRIKYERIARAAISPVVRISAR